MTALKIKLHNGEFNYITLGNGPATMIAFHGFGQDGMAFSPLAEALPGYTLYSVELPFHGKTSIFDPSSPMTPPDIAALVTELQKSMDFGAFSVAGFSIGARMVSPVVQLFAGQVEKVFLIAPDGITESKMYFFATCNKLTRALFRTALRMPRLMAAIVRATKMTGLIDRKTAKLVRNSLRSREKSMQIYYTWTYLRKLRIATDDLAALVNDNRIRVFFVVAKYDKVIKPRYIRPLADKITNKEIITLPCGHYELIEAFAGHIKARGLKGTVS